MSVQCQRCGDPAIPMEGATHVFCERCADIASTGARDSSELLFTLAPRPRDEGSLSPMGRDSAADLASLARPAIRVERSDDELGALLAIAPPELPIKPPRARSWTAVTVVALAVLVASSAAFAWRATRPTMSPKIEPKPALTAAPVVAHREPSIQPPAILPTEVEPEPIVAAPVASAPSTELPPRESAVPSPITLHPRPGRLAASQRPRPVAVETQTRAPRPVATEEAPRPSLAPLPTRGDVRAAMDSVSTAVMQCAEGSHGLVQARVTFRGETGRVMHAEVVDSTLPPSARSCIAVALRGARVQPFAQDRFIVAYPYRL